MPMLYNKEQKDFRHTYSTGNTTVDAWLQI